MTDLVYEQPLNEKIRGYLRLEYLSQQLQENLTHDHLQRCFYPLFSLCELTERCDYRNDILKDIERSLALLQSGQGQNAATQLQMAAWRDGLSQARDALQKPERFGSQLKLDKFLAALRQRFAMPGACCNFDLPQLHFWLAKPWQERQQDYQQWMAHFEPLLTPIALLLEMTRSTAEYAPATAEAAFYQASSAQALSLVRVKIDPAHGCYPTISGHKNRYAIHFVQFDQLRHSDRSIPFLLAACV